MITVYGIDPRRGSRVEFGDQLGRMSYDAVRSLTPYHDRGLQFVDLREDLALPIRTRMEERFGRVLLPRDVPIVDVGGLALSSFRPRHRHAVGHVLRRLEEGADAAGVLDDVNRWLREKSRPMDERAYQEMKKRWQALLDGGYLAKAPEIGKLYAFWAPFMGRWEEMVAGVQEEIGGQAANLAIAESNAASHGYKPAAGSVAPRLPGQPVFVLPVRTSTAEERNPVLVKIDEKAKEIENTVLKPVTDRFNIAIVAALVGAGLIVAYGRGR